MGLISVIRKLLTAPEPITINHPQLGTIIYSPGGWQVEHYKIDRFDNIWCILEGTIESPSQNAINACLWAQDNWDQIFNLIAQTAFEDVYKPYADSPFDVPQINSAEELKPAARLSGFSFKTQNTFELTLRFTWQDPNDDHLISFHIEDGTCIGTSFDG